MKKLFLISLILLISFQVQAQVPYKNFEIVETIPDETNLDNPEIRDALEVWLEMIDGAKKTLDIEQFYICTEPGQPLELVIDSILDAAKRGVKVRVIGDNGFYRTYPETLDLLGETENIEMRLINFRKIKGSGVQHSKFFIVDGDEVFVGSQNFDWKALKHIHEIGLRVKHEEAGKAFSDLFELDWKLCKAETPEEAKKLVELKEYNVPFSMKVSEDKSFEFYPVFSPTDLSPDPDLWTLDFILKGFEKAQSEINIELLSYTPISRGGEYWAELEVAIRKAAVRGVKVRMVVSDWNKGHPKIDYLKSLQMVPNIEVKLSTIPEHSSGFISYARVTHSKFMTVDDSECWVGCSNWSKGYYYGSRDAGFYVLDEEVTQTLIEIFQKDWQSKYTYLVKPEVDYEKKKRE